MTKTQRFIVWLSGFLEACEEQPTPEQVEKIKSRLNDIFEHVAEEPKTQKLTLEELGKEHDFEVYPGFPPKTNMWGGSGKELYRC